MIMANPSEAPGIPGARMDKKLRELLQFNQDYFGAYRCGRLDEWFRQVRARQRRSIWATYDVPQRRSGPVAPDGRPEGALLLRPGAQRKRYQGWGRDAQKLQQYEDEVSNGQYRMMEYLRPLGFRLQKVLGRGGFGIACLFKMTDVNGETHTIVVKAGIRSQAMTLERTNSMSPSHTASSQQNLSREDLLVKPKILTIKIVSESKTYFHFSFASKMIRQT